MAEIIDLKEFLNESYQKAFVYQTLRGLELTKTIESNYTERYAIQITFDAHLFQAYFLNIKYIILLPKHEIDLPTILKIRIYL